MNKTLKKAISALLAVLMLSIMCAPAFAAGDEQTYHMVLEPADKYIRIVPLDGYDVYVRAGGDFRFYVWVDETMSDKHVIVEVDLTTIQPDVHGVYTISEINEDHTINAYFEMSKSSSNLFSSLMILIHNVFAWFKSLFESLRG